jgi:hypothetical protein
MRIKVIGRQDELIWWSANCGTYSALGWLNPSEQEYTRILSCTANERSSELYEKMSQTVDKMHRG